MWHPIGLAEPDRAAAWGQPRLDPVPTSGSAGAPGGLWYQRMGRSAIAISRADKHEASVYLQMSTEPRQQLWRGSRHLILSLKSQVLISNRAAINKDEHIEPRPQHAKSAHADAPARCSHHRQPGGSMLVTETRSERSHDRGERQTLTTTIYRADDHGRLTSNQVATGRARHSIGCR